MAKQIDYPRSSLKNCLDLARAIDELGGSCSSDMAADKLNKKMSGAFTALIASASRFALIRNNKGQLETSDLYKEYKLAYTEEEARRILSIIFLTPPLFAQIFERFKGLELPVSHFEKLLIREFNVPDQMSSRVAKYFLDGAKQCQLIDANHVLMNPEGETDIEDIGLEGGIESNAEDDTENLNQNPGKFSEKPRYTMSAQGSPADANSHFSVRILGPGMDSTIAINEEEDLEIVQAMLRKVEKRLKSMDKDSEQ